MDDSDLAKRIAKSHSLSFVAEFSGQVDCDRKEGLSMARFLKWAAVALIGLLLALAVVAVVFSAFRFGFMPMMARGFRVPFVYGGSRFIAWAFLLGRLLIPLAFMAFLVVAGFAIVRTLAAPRTPTASMTVCRNCGRPVQADWNHCPFCGTRLQGEAPVVSSGEDVS